MLMIKPTSKSLVLHHDPNELDNIRRRQFWQRAYGYRLPEEESGNGSQEGSQSSESTTSERRSSQVPLALRFKILNLLNKTKNAN